MYGWWRNALIILSAADLNHKICEPGIQGYGVELSPPPQTHTLQPPYTLPKHLLSWYCIHTVFLGRKSCPSLFRRCFEHFWLSPSAQLSFGLPTLFTTNLGVTCLTNKNGECSGHDLRGSRYALCPNACKWWWNARSPLIHNFKVSIEYKLTAGFGCQIVVIFHW